MDGAKPQQAEAYASQYSALEDFVAGSLEQHKPELRGVLFPLFVHCYFYNGR